MKKVLLNTFEGFPSSNTGGPNRVIYQLIRYINNDEISFDFSTYKYLIKNIKICDKLTNENKPPIKKTVTNYLYDNCRFYRNYTTSKNYLRKHYFKRDYYFDKLAHDYRCDVIHSHSSQAHYYFRNNNAKKILSIHSKGSIQNDISDDIAVNQFLQEYSNEIRKREIAAFNCSDVVTFPSEFAKSLFLNDYKGELNENIPVHIIYNGVDTNYINSIRNDNCMLEKMGIKKHSYDLILLNVANHVKQKNIGEILIFISKIKSSLTINPFLINVGEGPLTNNLKDLTNKLNLKENVYFVSKLSYKNVISLMKECDALIMLSERVIFDLVILDAVASNVYIISNLNGGNNEILPFYSKFVDYQDSELLTYFLLNKSIPTKYKNVDFNITKYDIRNITSIYKSLY